ncbi:hypothetical protein [Devosia sp. 63-57]|uniref:tetratricopeptide repeat protein n=1 Tax=Devosia sp. 63-57 TaxID=1895751 RepID=UPI000A40C4D0|nr:hypothetical protein [Devosia sp. 63-57]
MVLNRILAATSMLALAWALSGPALAEDAAQTCDALAASAFDQTRPDGVPGVPFDAIDVAAAQEACLAALAEAPSPRIAFQLGRALHRAGALDDAIGYYMQAVEAGHAEAMVGLAEAGRQKSAEESAALTEAASAAGSVIGRYNLAVLKRDGDGLTQDIAGAIALFEASAAAGDAEAAYNLGVLYDEGELVLRDVGKARQFYEAAVADGHSFARVNLGYLLLEGKPDEQARAEALALFRLAAEEDGDINAGLQLGLMLQDGSAAEQAESETLVLAALRDRDFELGRFLQQSETGISQSNVKAIQGELGVPASGVVDAATLEALRRYFDHMP